MMKALTYRWTPNVIDQNQTQKVLLEVEVEGTPTAVTLHLQTPGAVVTLKDDGSGGDKQAGDGVFTATVAAADVLKNFTADDVNRNYVGELKLQATGGQTDGPHHLFADVLTAGISTVQITKLSGDVQLTEHLVNIADPDFFTTFAVEHVTTRFYEVFGDDYDFINVVYEIAHFKNRRHFPTRNDVQGIGLPPFDNTATYGSAGRLLGRTIFPIPTMFDGASPAYVHELGHQWINYLTVPPLDGGIPHYPLSDLATCIMGWSPKGGDGLVFDLDLKPAGAGFVLVPSAGPKSYCDLSRYLMGLLPADQVKDHFVFKDQSQLPAAGPVPKSALIKVSINDVLQNLGPRVPDSTAARKRFRVATIMVSRDGLLSAAAMRLYDHFAARAEATTALPFSDGYLKGTTNPFYLATATAGRLDARITRRILVDASRDGGVWWSPQTGPFHRTAPHQGQALADHLRSLGHTVDELPRPTAITAAVLKAYDVVIRAVGHGSYAPAEITAYHDYVTQGGGLLLLAEFGPTDGVAASFGLTFEGRTRGDNILDTFTAHAITKGVGPLAYRVGAGLTKTPAAAHILGKLSTQSFLDLNANGVKDAGEPAAPPVLGAMAFGAGRIVFCGDANLWQGVPQPLTRNVIKWLTDP